MKPQTGRTLYSLPELYDILFKGMTTARFGSDAVRQGVVTADFKERLMLAVTEVNNCPMCSYFHARVALESGMSQEEIEAMLAGTMEGVPAEELPAVLFAQHYAEMRGKPTREAWQGLVKQYGFEKARGILGLVRTIMVGNAYGIPMGSLKNRFKGSPDPRCTLGYELSVFATLLPFVVVALIHAFFRRMAGRTMLTGELAGEPQLLKKGESQG